MRMRMRVNCFASDEQYRFGLNHKSKMDAKG